MLTDPQAVTISGSAITLPRIEERAETHVYSDRTNKVDLYVTQKVDKKGTLRSSASLVKSVIVTDAVTGVKSLIPYSINVNQVQPIGITSADVEALYDALTNALEASTKVLLKKFLNGEK